MYQGIGASSGVAIGKVLLINDQRLEIQKKHIEDCNAEIKRLDQAIVESKNQLKRIIKTLDGKLNNGEIKIIEAHIFILSDPEFIESVISKIREDKVIAEYAVKQVVNRYIRLFDEMDNEYMRERAADIKDVGKRIINNLLGKPPVDFSIMESDIVIVAPDLKPSDTIQMDPKKVLGIVVDKGGRMSHSSILARSMGIPAVVGLGNLSSQVKSGDKIIVDGDNGRVFINPDENTLELYKNKVVEQRKIYEDAAAFRNRPTITLDGIKLELAANIFSSDEALEVLKEGAEGIGLFRTEFLYMHRKSLPSEEEQFREYKRVLEIMKGKPVIIRTLDIGGDKDAECLNLAQETNPFLGFRAIRISLERKDIFRTQLRALLRAGVYGNLKIMYPMVSSIGELDEANRILDDERFKLEKEGIDYGCNIQVGIMVETPAAALLSEKFAKKVDFFSIGTNDLTQYTLAVDRTNKKVEKFYDPFHPAVLRLISLVIENGHKNNIWVGMCGEMAGDLNAIPLLVGMGIDELSMNPKTIPIARKLISKLKQKEWAEMVCQILDMENPQQVREYIKRNLELE